MSEIVGFQIVTENIASTVEPNIRVMEYISPSWNFIVILLAMLFMVINKQFYTMRFRMMLSVLTHASDSGRMAREWNPIVSVNGLTVFVAYIALMALVVQKIVVVFSENTILYNTFSFYLDVCAFIALLCILQYIVISLYGWLFDIETATTHEEVMHLSTMSIIDIALIILGLIMIFYPTKFILIFISIIILIINGIRIIKTFFDFQMLSKMNLLNNFLYFCTLEIIPLSVAITMMCRLIVTNCVL